MPFFDDPGDPYSEHTVMGWIRSWKLGKALEAGYGHTEGIKAEIGQMHAAEKAGAEAFWAQMKADGVPVAQAGSEAGDEPGPELEAQ